MIPEIHESKLGESVYMTELYDCLELDKSQYSRFVKHELIENPYAECDLDYSTQMSSINVIRKPGRFRTEYEVSRDFALKICMVSKSKNSEIVKNGLIKVFNEKRVGQSFSVKQIEALMDLCPVMGLITVQRHVEKQHSKYHNNKNDWWQYRANILGYSASQLKTEVEKLNVKYKNQRQALIHIDKYELIRNGIIDLFIALGKTVEYSVNVADLCKKMAVKMKVEIWNDKEEQGELPLYCHNEKLKSAIKNNQLKLQ